MNRIILTQDQFQANTRATLSSTQTQHVRRVLKRGPNDTLRIGVLNGPTGQGRIVGAEGQHIEIKCTLEETPPPPPVDLLLAMPRPKVMRRLWPVLASMGLGRIILTNAARVERNYFDTQWLDISYFTPLLVEGLQQSGDTHLPKVSVERRLKPFIEDHLDALLPDALRIMGDPYGRGTTAPITPAKDQRMLVAVGPEGGWDDYECRMLATHGFQTVSLGWRILRSDTACISLLTLAHEWSRSA